MLPDVSLPASLLVLFDEFRCCFTAPTFAVFRVLAAGLIGQTGRRTVCGMLLGAGAAMWMAHDRAHRFFSTARWSADQLGLVLARLIVDAFVSDGAPLQVAVDDTMFRRRGRRVAGAFWFHDASLPGLVTARGNRWVIVGLVVDLPFTSRPTCLPVLLRLWGGAGTPSPVALARQAVGVLARAFPDRVVHVVADGAYHGPALHDLPARVTWTTRMPVTAVLRGPLPPPVPGRRGRPPVRGPKLGSLTDVAAAACWQTVNLTRYGRTTSSSITAVTCQWYGSFGARLGRAILVRDPGRATLLALFTTDQTNPAEQVVTRYAGRWSIEVAIANAKGPTGAGQARNRTPNAVARTVPFAMITMGVVTIWYARAGHHPADTADRRTRQPWYTTKTEPSYEDMIAKLRRVIIAHRFMPERLDQPTPQQIHAVHQAWAAAGT
jgi:DDE superfamily endonuclease